MSVHLHVCSVFCFFQLLRLSCDLSLRSAGFKANNWVSWVRSNREKRSGVWATPHAEPKTVGTDKDTGAEWTFARGKLSVSQHKLCPVCRLWTKGNTACVYTPDYELVRRNTACVYNPYYELGGTHVCIYPGLWNRGNTTCVYTPDYELGGTSRVHIPFSPSALSFWARPEVAGWLGLFFRLRPRFCSQHSCFFIGEFTDTETVPSIHPKRHSLLCFTNTLWYLDHRFYKYVKITQLSIFACAVHLAARA